MIAAHQIDGTTVKVVCGACHVDYDHSDHYPYGQIQGGCGHTVCKACVIEMTEKKVTSCPICKVAIKKEWAKNEVVFNYLDVYTEKKSLNDKLREDYREKLEETMGWAENHEVLVGERWELGSTCFALPQKRPKSSRDWSVGPMKVALGIFVKPPNCSFFEFLDGIHGFSYENDVLKEFISQLELEKEVIMLKCEFPEGLDKNENIC